MALLSHAERVFSLLAAARPRLSRRRRRCWRRSACAIRGARGGGAGVWGSEAAGVGGGAGEPAAVLLMDEPTAGMAPARAGGADGADAALATGTTSRCCSPSTTWTWCSARPTGFWCCSHGEVIAEGDGSGDPRGRAGARGVSGLGRDERGALMRAPARHRGPAGGVVDWAGGDILQAAFSRCRWRGAGEVTVLLGRNGAGKSTTMKTVIGLVRPRGGRILFGGQNMPGWPPHRIAPAGLGYVPEERRIFTDLTVAGEPRGRAAAGARGARRGPRRGCSSCFRTWRRCGNGRAGG